MKLIAQGIVRLLIIAAKIYWQTKEISRVLAEENTTDIQIEITLLAHISPIEWSNIIFCMVSIG